MPGVASGRTVPPAVTELQFYALRHGQSAANVAYVISSDPEVASRTYGLTELGKSFPKF